jgi:hypothetical protein
METDNKDTEDEDCQHQPFHPIFSELLTAGEQYHEKL